MFSDHLLDFSEGYKGQWLWYQNHSFDPSSNFCYLWTADRNYKDDQGSISQFGNIKSIFFMKLNDLTVQTSRITHIRLQSFYCFSEIRNLKDEVHCRSGHVPRCATPTRNKWWLNHVWKTSWADKVELECDAKQSKQTFWPWATPMGSCEGCLNRIEIAWNWALGKVGVGNDNQKSVSGQVNLYLAYTKILEQYKRLFSHFSEACESRGINFFSIS